MPKLTKALIAAAERPETGTKTLWDTTVPGFGVRISSGGTKTFILKYRTRNERLVRWLTIARVGDVTLDEARDEATKHRGDIAKGGDPAGERSSARKAMTVSELCDDYLKDCAIRPRPLRPNTIASHSSNIENHIRPALGKRVAKAVTADDVERLQAAIATGKTAARKPGRGGIASGGEGAAARCIAVLGAILEYGRRMKVVELNPVGDVRKLPPKSKDRFLSSDEIRRFGEAMRDAALDGESRSGIAAARFLLLSGFRRNEALTLEPDFIDYPGQCARLPSTKTGKQVRALGKAALDALREAPATRNWCFPGERGDGHFVGLPKILKQLFARAGIAEASAHDLRRTFATVAVELGFSELVIAALLGHKTAGVTARYARTPDKALLLAADAISARIATLLSPVPAAAIIPIRA
ncbi:tyrosine-type recombinase/integrase [Rhizobium lentis]|uniref:tyrosine-type recombinase/integrase n=1 Tax=Rhizobium lentis TaxID=1138194 RepID=UPI001C8283EF|nr:site-specific integrase [Rhizobium lentis]MBX5144970.1 integrase arm-type DNA-binding domain-containing protein [Rhizobium lentis]